CNTVLNSFLPTRSGVVINQLKAKGLFPTVAAPAFSQLGGNVAAGYSLTLSAPVGTTIYYTLDGSDPRVIGGGVSAAAKTYSGAIIINNSLRVRARVLS